MFTLRYFECISWITIDGGERFNYSKSLTRTYGVRNLFDESSTCTVTLFKDRPRWVAERSLNDVVDLETRVKCRFDPCSKRKGRIIDETHSMVTK